MSPQPRSELQLTRIEQALLDHIEATAQSLEQRALTNEAYAEILDVTVGQVKRAILNLVRFGLIQSQSNGNGQRRFYIARLDLWTRCSVRRREEETKPKTTKRPCITCGTSFPSEGPHHRMCGSCRCTAEEIATFGLAPSRRSIGAAA